MNELLNPNFQDQREVFDTQFDGMSSLPFTYEDYESTRIALLEELDHKLTEGDRRFLLSFKSGEPDWALCPIAGLEAMASVQWKLQNIQKLKEKNPKKHSELLARLGECLGLKNSKKGIALPNANSMGNQ